MLALAAQLNRDLLRPLILKRRDVVGDALLPPHGSKLSLQGNIQLIAARPLLAYRCTAKPPPIPAQALRRRRGVLIGVVV